MGLNFLVIIELPSFVYTKFFGDLGTVIETVWMRAFLWDSLESGKPWYVNIFEIGKLNGQR